MIKLYHGSVNIVEQPIFGQGKIYNDYGLGFYCTEDIDMAKEWAVTDTQDGYANCYELDLTDLSILDLNHEGYTILHWLSVLLANRRFDAPSALALEAKEYLFEHFSVNFDDYDLIKGYRADDSYFSFAQDFVNGTISYRQLGNAMRLGKLGQQIVLKSEAAFLSIRHIGYEVARKEEWYIRKNNRDKTARREYFDNEKNRRMKGDIYITHILDEEMMPDDPRLR